MCWHLAEERLLRRAPRRAAAAAAGARRRLVLLARGCGQLAGDVGRSLGCR